MRSLKRGFYGFEKCLHVCWPTRRMVEMPFVSYWLPFRMVGLGDYFNAKELRFISSIKNTDFFALDIKTN